jgi:hypothetical protein
MRERQRVEILCNLIAARHFLSILGVMVVERVSAVVEAT